MLRKRKINSRQSLSARPIYYTTYYPMCRIHYCILVLTFTNTLVCSINTKTLITINVFRHGTDILKSDVGNFDNLFKIM